MGLSGLNSHRKRYHFINYSTCPRCQFRNEDALHYLLQCQAYAVQRADMVTSLLLLLPHTENLFQSMLGKDRKVLVNIMLNGIKDENIDIEIFKIVSKFIQESQRFL